MDAAAQNLDSLSALVWRVTAQSDFNVLSQKVSILSAQIAVHQALEPTSRHLRSVTVFPNAQSRLSKFMDTIYGVGEVKERFQKLRQFDHATFLFIALSYTPLEITKMNRTEFEYLTQNASEFLQMKQLPPRWIFRDEVQVALASKSSLENATSFRKGLTTSARSNKITEIRRILRSRIPRADRGFSTRRPTEHFCTWDGQKAQTKTGPRGPTTTPQWIRS